MARVPKDAPAGSPAAPGSERALAALIDLAQGLARHTDQAGLVACALEHLPRALEAGGAGVWLFDFAGELALADRQGLDSPDPAGTAALAREALERGETRVRSLAEGWMAASPLGPAASRLGVLTAHDRRPGPPPAAPRMLAALAGQLGSALDRVRLSGELQATAARLELLHRLTATLTSDIDLSRAVPAFAVEVAALLEFDRLACGFLNDAGDYLEVLGHPEGSGWGFGPVHPVVGSGPGSVLLSGEPVVQDDLLHRHRFIEDLRLLEEGIRSYVLLPLHARGRIIGVLALGSRRPGAYDEGVAGRLQPVTDAAALALDNVRLLHRTRELSITDEVTPLYNFRFFHQILERELKLVDRYHSCLSLVFLDLDRFKPINDQYGHLRGSRVLREVGFLVRANVRETDYPVRYGGDEFVVILPQTDRAPAEVLAGKLRRAIEGHHFLQEEGIHARIGASLGVATYPTEASDKNSLIRLADARMYADKEKRGR